MASIESEQLASLFGIDLEVKIKGKDNGQVDGSETAKEKKRPLSKEVPWRVADAEKDGMLVRRSVRPW